MAGINWSWKPGKIKHQAKHKRIQKILDNAIPKTDPTKAAYRFTIPASSSKTTQIRTGVQARSDGSSVSNQGGKHSRNVNAAMEKVVAQVDKRLGKWHGKQARKRQLEKQARKDMRPKRVRPDRSLTSKIGE